MAQLEVPSVYTTEIKGDLRRLDHLALEAKVRSALDKFATVTGAWLFGSALDFVRPQSDIDVGVLLTEETVLAREETTAEIEEALGRFGIHPFQVVALSHQNSNFTFRVVNKGKLIYVRDELALTDFIEEIANHHRFHERFRRVYEKARGRSFGTN